MDRGDSFLRSAVTRAECWQSSGLGAQIVSLVVYLISFFDEQGSPAMLTQQEALEAMAGRSPEGKPLVFVSQEDYAALSKKHEDLLSAVRKQRTFLRSLLLTIGIA
jgi:hypothetical protein